MTVPAAHDTDITASAPDKELEAFQRRTRQVAFSIARRRNSCDQGLNITLANLGLPPVQCIKDVTVIAGFHPAGHTEQELFTDPAAAWVHVAVALHRHSLTAGQITDLTAVTRHTVVHDEDPDGRRQTVDNHTIPRTVVTARLTVPVDERITDLTPTPAERHRATTAAGRILAEITGTFTPNGNDRYRFHGKIINMVGMTVGDHDS
jgi:hypothetical protein